MLNEVGFAYLLAGHQGPYHVLYGNRHYTLTAGKFNAREFLEDQGINFETIKTGKNADALSFVDGE